jgi:pSer/pThr/pTyr-binding forkhead associated (FHA) protein|tara:strand:- start:275 stop:1480 length:1206 start_codon:yes stop_codon:yes gene_type:complete
MVLGLNFFKYSEDPIAYITTSFGTLEVHDTKTTIGRIANSDIVLSDIWVSRQHATITFDITHFRFLYEDHSTNGTHINNHFVHNRVIVLPNIANITIGAGRDITRMRFQTSYSALIDMEHKMHVIPISKEFLLGREGLHEIPSHYGHVSRQHAVIRYDVRAHHYILIDNSSNGSYVGQRRIHHSRHILQDNDRISLAGQYNYIFRHYRPEPVHNVRPKVVEPQRIGEAEWQELIKYGSVHGMWKQFNGALPISTAYTSWKFHIYADEVDDLFMVGRILVPALRDEKITFKTVAEINLLQRLSGAQQGKAFSVYICSQNSTDIRTVRATADQYFHFIHSLLDRTEIRTRHKQIEGDRQVPGDRTGRIFYRYDGLYPGPGPDKGYRDNEFGNAHNIPGNQDIF